MNSDKTLTPTEWQQRYKNHDTPWAAHELLNQVIESVKLNLPVATKILEIGTGFGYEASELASSGFKVHAIDIADEAIKKANTTHQHDNLFFQQANFFDEEFAPKDISAIVDIMVLHTQKTLPERLLFTEKLANLLKHGQYWFHVSIKKPDSDVISAHENVDPPPGLSIEELTLCTNAFFSLEDQQQIGYQIMRNGRLILFPAWFCLFMKR